RSGLVYKIRSGLFYKIRSGLVYKIRSGLFYKIRSGLYCSSNFCSGGQTFSSSRVCAWLVGCTPSACIRAGWLPMPSRKNGMWLMSWVWAND
ncbi:MAG: hypothetical protein KUG75_08165, partial [Pseudomonadales bacterium]|nr:hypothetical protein [Pseudomonadales bacterium]